MCDAIGISFSFVVFFFFNFNVCLYLHCLLKQAVSECPFHTWKLKFIVSKGPLNFRKNQRSKDEKPIFPCASISVGRSGKDPWLYIASELINAQARMHSSLLRVET